MIDFDKCTLDEAISSIPAEYEDPSRFQLRKWLEELRDLRTMRLDLCSIIDKLKK